MAEHLWPLLQLETDSVEELKEGYRKVFIETYVRTAEGKPIEIHDWNGVRIHFNPRNFEHAFSESTDYRFGLGEHDIPLSIKRASRLLWIKEVLAASRGTIERWNQMRKDSRNRMKKRRVLLVVEERYLVVLEETAKTGQLEFVSAFPASSEYLEKIKKESVLIEIKKPQS